MEINGWLGSWMGVWVYGCMGVWVHGCMGAWVYARMGVCADGCVDGVENEWGWGTGDWQEVVVEVESCVVAATVRALTGGAELRPANQILLTARHRATW